MKILDLSAGRRAQWHDKRRDAILTLKWNDHDISLSRVIALMEPWWEPLYGQTTAVRSAHKSATTWTVFKRREQKANA